MNVEKLTPKPSCKVLFRLVSFQRVTTEAGCYVLTTSEGEILYLGLAVNLRARFQQHLENPEKTQATKQGKAFLFYWHEYDGENLNKLERSWLNQYVTVHGSRPVLNKMDSPIS